MMRAAATCVLFLGLFGGGLRAQPSRADTIPLPEHPRPDFERAEWLNLNGRWQFAFDPRNEGERAGWPGGALPAGREIVVPFSWGAPLSGVPDSADVGWYARSVTVPEAWRGRRGVARPQAARRAPGWIHAVLVRADGVAPRRPVPAPRRAGG